VNLDAVETGPQGPLGTGPKLFDDAGIFM